MLALRRRIDEVEVAAPPCQCGDVVGSAPVPRA
jgi:hypothetical protein